MTTAPSERRTGPAAGDRPIGLPASLDVGEERLEEYRRALARDLGPVIYNMLMNPAVGDIYANANGCLLTRERGKKGFQLHSKRLSNADRRKICHAILSIHNLKDIPNKGTFNVELPFDGSRCAIVSPAAADGWELTIRKRTSDRFTPQEMVEQGVFSWGQIEGLAQAMFERQTIGISGATGAGKTVVLQMLLDMLVKQIWPTREEMLQRLILIEHVQELWVEYPNHVRWRTDYGVAMQELMHQALRADPDRIISGEQRDGTTLAYFRAITTGHPGALFTVHANSADHAPQRCVDLIHEASATADAARLVNEAVEFFVHVHRFQDGTRRAKVVRLDGVGQNGAFKTVPLVPKVPATVSYGGNG